MLNEPGEEWQGLQLSVQNNTADVLDKHTHQETSCVSLPIALSQDCFSLPKVMIQNIIRELPLSSYRILEIKIKMMNSINFSSAFILELLFLYMKKESILFFCSTPQLFI